MTTRDDSSPLTPATPPRRRARTFAVGLAGLILLQLVLTFHFERPALIFGEAPNAWMDFDTHIEQSFLAIEALDRWGESWAYDAHLLAGNPNGTVFAADNKGWDLVTFVFWKLGMPKGTAFNMFILLAHLLVPWAAFAAARLFNLARGAALLAAYLALGLWYFDSFAHWTWWCGMVAYGIVGYATIVPFALFHRFLERGGLLWWTLLSCSLAAIHLIHPYAFFTLAVPMGAAYLVHRRGLPLRRHAGIGLAAALTVAANAYWLVPALRFWHYQAIDVEDGVYAQSTPAFLLPDLFGLLKDPMATGFVDQRTGLRTIVLVAGGLGLAEWFRHRDRRRWPFTLGIGFMLSVTYFLGPLTPLTYVQPYRHIMPATFLAAIPAASFIVSFPAAIRALRGSRVALATLYLAIGLGATGLVRDALYFLPGLVPTTASDTTAEMAARRTNPEVPDATATQMDLRHGPTFPDFDALARALQNHDDRRGRVLVEWEILGEHLRWRTKSHILGGFRLRNLEHAQANLFRRLDERTVDEAEIRRYFEDYAVHWVIVSQGRYAFESSPNLLELVGVIPPNHRIYRTARTSGFLSENSGTVTPAINRLTVNGTDPARDVVLRFHDLETLVCEPDCRIVNEPVPGDPVGFIRVPSPHPADFVISNSYRFNHERAGANRPR